jgi:NAD(P)-dependent dehydrogenase (short-subunit alcohol dehydrogenase family)
MNILITGTSSGLGYELAKQFIAKDDTVYGISRSQCDLDIIQLQCDFKDIDINSLQQWINGLPIQFDLVILNAGILGTINTLDNIPVQLFNEIFTVNVLANKILLDCMRESGINIKQVIGISSGAALKSYYGWSLYCCSKAAFKQLISTYAQEWPDTHFISLAPGIIKTKMQDYIYTINAQDIPSVKKFKDIYDTMETADLVAKKIIKYLPSIAMLDSGGYYDIRNINEINFA